MTTRSKFLLGGAAVLVALVVWRAGGGGAPMTRWFGPVGVNAAVERRTAVTLAPNAEAAEAAATAVPKEKVALSRRETVAELIALYREEQLTRELDLEQWRFGRNYWEPDRDGPMHLKVQRAREALLKELSSEANRALSELCPGEAGEPITLTAIFSEERVGPNLAFLTPAQRRRFEAEALAGWARADNFTTEGLLGVAARVLTAAELDVYRQWNEPPNAALRNRLAGFNATESEFGAIREEERLGAEATIERVGMSGLELRIGGARYAEWRKLQEPAMRTAVDDLRRAGVSIGNAAWLVAVRGEAAVAIKQVWENPAWSDEAKKAEVARLQQSYAQTIASKFALSGSTLEDLNPRR